MSRVKSLAIAVIALGSAGLLAATPAPARAATPQAAMCAFHQCFENGRCVVDVFCWNQGCPPGCSGA